MTNERNRGFTLIELLVVLAVTAILIIALGAYWISNRPHYRLGAAARDLASDIRHIRANAVKHGVTATVATINFTSTTRYQVLVPNPGGVPDPDVEIIRQYDPDLAGAGETGVSGEYEGVVFTAQPNDLFACSNGMLDDVSPADSSGCDGIIGAVAGTNNVPIGLRHPDVDIWTAGNQPEDRTVCVFSTGAVSCWKGVVTANDCDDPSVNIIPAGINAC